mmetsp:Transcript_9770/g.25141  ORF Transcript_9770/g.25141 Transcript_9770/m.25141 type:complete len:184 (+) Transcript_9770:522-1073(+)
MKLGNGMHKMWQPEEEWGIIDRLLGIVDVKAAKAKFEDDRVRILEEVKKIARSFSRADSIIRGAIVGAAWGARLPEVQAAACGELKALQAVFKKYPNLEKKGVTPLVSAAASGHLVVVKELLRMGATVNKITKRPPPFSAQDSLLLIKQVFVFLSDTHDIHPMGKKPRFGAIGVSNTLASSPN